MLTVPSKITPDLKAFCRAISPAQPVYVPSRPPADARQHLCFENVAGAIERGGGEIVHGWAVWHLPRLCFEAEHHGVWRDRKGALLDVSPQFQQAPKILFLPDLAAVYDPARFRPNIFKAVDDGFLSGEFVVLARARNEIVNRYRSNGHLTLAFSLADQIELADLNRRLSELMALAGHNLPG